MASACAYAARALTEKKKGKGRRAAFVDGIHYLDRGGGAYRRKIESMGRRGKKISPCFQRALWERATEKSPPRRSTRESTRGGKRALLPLVGRGKLSHKKEGVIYLHRAAVPGIALLLADKSWRSLTKKKKRSDHLIHLGTPRSKEERLRLSAKIPSNEIPSLFPCEETPALPPRKGGGPTLVKGS